MSALSIDAAGTYASLAARTRLCLAHPKGPRGRRPVLHGAGHSRELALLGHRDPPHPTGQRRQAQCNIQPRHQQTHVRVCAETPSYVSLTF